MDCSHIAERLRPFIEPELLTQEQLQSISMHIDLLTRWNSRINLTSIREPEEMVTRHFGESLFAARNLLSPNLDQQSEKSGVDLLDLGSGAGFPGLPIKIWAPSLRITLVESNHKKATFLREVIRILTLTDIDVFSGRAEDFPASARLVTLRAVERFDNAVLTASRLLAPGGRLALLIGSAQADVARRLAPNFTWGEPISIPLSSNRILLSGKAPEPAGLL